MKQIGFVVVGVVLGFLLGGIGPRSELSDVRSDLMAANERADEAERKALRKSGGSMFLPGMSQAFSTPSSDDAEEPNERRFGKKSDNGGAEIVIVDGEEGGGGPGADLPPEERFDLAVDAQRIRSEQSRAALQQQGDLSDEQMDHVDDIVDRMNGELAYLGEDVLDLMLSDTEPEAADVLGVSHEVTGVLYDAQTEKDAVVAESGEEVDPEASEVWNHIDLEEFRSAFEEMQDAGVGPGSGAGGGMGGGPATGPGN